MGNKILFVDFWHVLENRVRSECLYRGGGGMNIHNTVVDEGCLNSKKEINHIKLLHQASPIARKLLPPVVVVHGSMKN